MRVCVLVSSPSQPGQRSRGYQTSRAQALQRGTASSPRAAASQKLLFPLVFFIMPAVFIMIFGPIILGFLGVAN